MAIDFPNSPTLNQIYTVGSRSWIWDGSTWNIYANVPNRYIQDAPPSSPQSGDQWFESDTGRLFVYYDSVWVEIGNAATTNVNANDLSGTTLASNVVSSSLTSVGTLGSLSVGSTVTASTDYLLGSKSMPRGVIAYGINTTADSAISSERAVVTSASFTPVAGRVYRITTYEPQISSPATSGVFAVGRIRLTNISGTILNSSIIQNAPATGVNYTMITSWVGTLTAVSTVVVYTLAATATYNAQRSSTAVAYLMIEDMGGL